MKVKAMGIHTPTQTVPPRGGRKLSSVLVPVLLVLAGLAVLLYPVIATQWNNFGQMKASQEYAKLEKDVPEEVVNKSLEDALAYNETRTQSSVSDPWSVAQDENTPDYRAYKEQLSTWEAMARIVIPEANVNLPVYHGTSHETLQMGVGHLFGTDLPVGGESRHAVVTGHTGLQNATLFDNVSKLKVGDAIYLQVAGQKMKYKVRNIETVLPTEVDSLKREEGKDLLTLVTCTPYGINSHRLLVHAERTAMDPSDEQYFEQSGFHWQWWMWAIVVASIVIVLLLVLWVRSMRKGPRS